LVARPVDGELRGARLRLVEALREKGIRDLSVLRAFEMTPRHAFVPTGLRHRAYEDAPLPIGNGQTISQPWVHARYLELLHLTGKERVLEVGTGSGYQTVLLAHLVAQVFSIERIPALMQQARDNIHRAGVNNVSILLGDGTIGWREYAPYDAILVSAGAPSIPQPLLDQLAEGGRLLIPVGDRDEQKLILAERRNGQVEVRDGAPVRFVPLLGSHGWSGDGSGGAWMRLHVLVRGRVQGVGFRWFVRETARDLGLAGWVRNRPDGTVEVAAEGSAVTLERLRDELRKGPPGAAVTSVDDLEADDRVHDLPFGIVR
jgi:protein-L-isoaspartate(D-aspartate) O-methyltransferase